MSVYHQPVDTSRAVPYAEDAEAKRAAVEKEREVLTRRRERAEQEILSLERAARDLREAREFRVVFSVDFLF